MKIWSNAALLGHALALVACSGLKLDKDSNCLNSQSGCFKPDKTAPQFNSTSPANGPTNKYTVLTSIEITFSEEVKNGEDKNAYAIDRSAMISASANGGLNLNIVSVLKTGPYTYRINLSGSVTTGIIRLHFADIVDYGGNAITGNKYIDYEGSASVGIDINVYRNGSTPSLKVYGVSNNGAGAHGNVDIKFSHQFTIDNANTYTVYRTDGGVSCPPTGGFSSLGTGTNLPANQEITISNIAATTFLTANDRVVVCVSNTNNPAATGVASWPLIRDDIVPVSSANKVTDTYRDPDTVLLNCTNNADQIAVTTALQQNTPPADPADPDFTNGIISAGSLYNGGISVPNPVNPTVMKIRWRCIDKSGNKEAASQMIQLTIDNTIPAVNVNLDSTYRAFVSNAVGAYNSTTLNFTSDQANKEFRIASGTTPCSPAGGGASLIGAGPFYTNAIANAVNPPQNILATAFAAGLNHVRICVQGPVATIWGTAYLQITRDDGPITASASVIGGDYGAIQNVSISCTGNVDKIAYTVSTQLGASAPAAPTDPVFTAGAITVGQELTGPYNTPDASTSILKYKCLDKSGNQSPVGQQLYRIDASLPAVQLVSTNRVATSSAVGAFNDVAVTWNSSRAGLTYRVRSVLDCNHTGDPGSTIFTGTTPSVGTNEVTTLTNGLFPTNHVQYPVRICVYNFIGQASYQTAAINIMRDNIAPTYGGLTAISTPASGSAKVDWSAATDGVGSGVSFYRVYQTQTAGDYSSAQVYIVPAPATSFTATGLNPLNTYYFVAGAVDNAGNETKVTAAELASKPTIRLIVSGLDTANAKTFNLTDGVASGTISANSVAPGGIWVSSLAVGQTYNLNITAQPAGQVCAVRERQYGTLSADVTLNIQCNDGQMVGGRFQVLAPVAMNHMLYRSFATAHASAYAGNSIGNANSVAIAGGNVYFGSDADCPNGAPVGYCLYSVPVTGGSVSAVVSDFTYPIRGVASDGSNIYFTTIAPDNRLYKYSIAGAAVTEVVAGLNNPFGIAVEDRYVYVAQKGNNEIVRVDVVTGSITQLVTGLAGGAIAVTIVGTDLYFTVDTQHAIYRVPKTGGAASVVYGNASAAGFQDNSGTGARFNAPHDLTYDGAANLFVVEYGGHRLRRIRLSTGRVTTLAGDGVDGLFTGGIGPTTRISRPVGVATDGRYLFITLHGTDKRLVRITESGLKGHWPLAGNAVDYASDITSPQSGTVSGTPLTNTIDRFGNTGAYAFDGVDDFIGIAGTNLPGGNLPRSLCAWVRIPDATNAGNDGIVTYGVRGANTVFGLRLGDPVRVVTWDANGDLPLNVPAETTRWTHFCTTHDGSTTRAFFNGHLMAQATKSYSTSAGALCIGQRSNASGSTACDGGGFYFKGSIADVRVYSRALSEGEVNELAQDASSAQVGPSYNQGATELLAHYEFKGGSPPTANLVASGPVGGTLGGSASSPTGKDADASGAAYFGGSASLSLSATGLPLGNAPRTVCAFYRPQTLPTNAIRYVFSYGTGGTSEQFGIGIAHESGVSYLDNIFNSPSITSDHVYAYTSHINTWQHLCAVYTGTTSQLYYNGAQMSTNTRALNTLSGTARIGAIYGDGQYFVGDIDDVRVYNKALSQKEIRMIAMQVPAGLVARYDFTNDRDDTSGFGQDLNNNGANLGTDRFGIANNAAAFGGSASMDVTTNILPTGNAARTICAWTRPTNLFNGPFSEVVMYGTAANGWGFGMDASGGLPAGRIFILNAIADLIYARPHGLSIWRHVCATYDGTTERLYVEGSSVTSQVISLNTVSGSIVVGLGTFGGSDYFNGNIDDIQIYNRALTNAEIQILQRQPNKRIQLSGPTVQGDMGGSPSGIVGADQRCPVGYKAMIVDGTNRRACTTANCAGGMAEHIDWVLRPNITYVTNPAGLTVFTADWNSVWNFAGTPPTGGNFVNEIFNSSQATWTGLNGTWQVANSGSDLDCGNWGSAFVGDAGAFGRTNGLGANAIFNSTSTCDDAGNYLYCVQQ